MVCSKVQFSAVQWNTVQCSIVIPSDSLLLPLFVCSTICLNPQLNNRNLHPTLHLTLNTTLHLTLPTIPYTSHYSTVNSIIVIKTANKKVKTNIANLQLWMDQVDLRQCMKASLFQWICVVKDLWMLSERVVNNLYKKKFIWWFKSANRVMNII